MASLVWSKQRREDWMGWGSEGRVRKAVREDEEEGNEELVGRVLAVLDKVVGVCLSSECEGYHSAADKMFQRYTETRDERYVRGLLSLRGIVQAEGGTPPVWMETLAAPTASPVSRTGCFKNTWLDIVERLLLEDTEGAFCTPKLPPVGAAFSYLHLDTVRSKVIASVYVTDEDIEMDLRYVLYSGILRGMPDAAVMLSKLPSRLPWISPFRMQPSSIPQPKLQACLAAVAALIAIDSSNMYSGSSGLSSFSSRLRVDTYPSVEAFVQDLSTLMESVIRELEGEDRVRACAVAARVPSVLAEHRVW